MIYAQGPEKARVMLVGECHGEAEEKLKLPFQGMAGGVLDGILDEVGLPRALCRITNVVHRRPPNNNFSVFYKDGKHTPELIEAYDRLAQEIKDCNPNVVVCLGNEALKAVTWHSGIDNWRGSILTSPRTGHKVIPTYHPAFVLREWTSRPAMVCDFQKVVREQAFPEVRITPRELEINPSFERVMEVIDEAKRAEEVAFDIETETNQITCIGLSFRQNWAICIPFWYGSSGSIFSESQETLIWQGLKELLESTSPRKTAHNAMYELEYLWWTLGLKAQIDFDTLLGFHTLYSELPKSLAYLVSVYTDHPYYKYQRKAASMDELWKYNATDACLTFEVSQKIKKELEESQQMQAYRQLSGDLLLPLARMSR